MSAGLPGLVGRGVRLRQLDGSDVDALFAIFSDPLVMRYWSRGPLQHRDEAIEMLENIESGWLSDSFYQWGITPEHSDQVIGTTTLFAIERTHLRAEVGFALAPAWWGRGLGGAALDCAICHAFGELGLRRLEADVDPRNSASLRLLETRGFLREGLLRARYRVGGEVQDSVLLGLLGGQ